MRSCTFCASYAACPLLAANQQQQQILRVYLVGWKLKCYFIGIVAAGAVQAVCIVQANKKDTSCVFTFFLFYRYINNAIEKYNGEEKD